MRKNRIEHRIEHGDKVVIFANSSHAVVGTIDHIPISASDSWVLISEETQTVYYFQQFDQMRLIQKKG